METLLLWAATAAAVPASTTLVGERGQITWSIQAGDDGLLIVGEGPSWSVVHHATENWEPVQTTRTSADGRAITVDYYPWGARVTDGKRQSRYVRKGLWDADTIDLRLAVFADAAATELDFHAIDLADKRVYAFRAKNAGEASCLGSPCDRVKLALRGPALPGNPAWEFRYAKDGGLVEVSGASGAFKAAPASPGPQPAGS